MGRCMVAPRGCSLSVPPQHRAGRWGAGRSPPAAGRHPLVDHLETSWTGRRTRPRQTARGRHAGSLCCVGPTAVLLLSCPDQPGVVATVADFVWRNGGNIVHAEQHTDTTDGVFFQRVEFELEGFA